MRTFFDPIFTGYKKEYYYDIPQSQACTEIRNVFERSGQLFEGPDIRGAFITEHSFELEAPSGWSTGGGVYWSKLYGRIESNDGKTKVVTKVDSAFRYKFLLAFALVIGVLLFLKGLMTFDFRFVGWSIGMMVVAPYLIVRAADVNNAIVEDRYLRYLHTALQSPKGRQLQANGGSQRPGG